MQQYVQPSRRVFVGVHRLGELPLELHRLLLERGRSQIRWACSVITTCDGFAASLSTSSLRSLRSACSDARGAAWQSSRRPTTSTGRGSSSFSTSAQPTACGRCSCAGARRLDHHNGHHLATSAWRGRRRRARRVATSAS